MIAHQGNITIMNIYTLGTGASVYIKQLRADLKPETIQQCKN